MMRYWNDLFNGPRLDCQKPDAGVVATSSQWQCPGVATDL